MSFPKFRLIRNNKIVGYEEPLYQPNGIFRWQYQINYIPKDSDELVGPSGWSGIFINHHIKNQFTGLHDKNNNEIYEGDIIVDISDNTIKYEVILWNHCFGVFVYPDERCFLELYKISDLKLEIIGNVYENPELRGNK